MGRCSFFNFSRLIAMIVLISFTLAGCPFFVNPPENGSVVIKPGEGNPRYAYIDEEGNISETDTGKTLLFVENNLNAEGVFVVADKYGNEDRVTINNRNDGSVVCMYFKDNKKFPHRMEISVNEKIYYALFSMYRDKTSDYDVVFMHGNEAEMMNNLVLNNGIFSLYVDDENLKDSENQRLYNITIALGLWGSLAYYLDDPGKVVFKNIFGDFFKAVFKPIKAVFSAAAVVATTVAVVVAPIISFVSPELGAIVYNAATFVASVNNAIVEGISYPESSIDFLFCDGQSQAIYIFVNNYYENRPITNGEEYHISRGSDVILDFYIPNVGFKNTVLNPTYLQWYEPGVAVGSNSIYFKIDVIPDKNNVEAFQVKYTLLNEKGFTGDGKISFGFGPFRSNSDDDDIYINDDNKGITYKLKDDLAEKMYKGLIVIKFCIDPSCDDYADKK